MPATSYTLSYSLSTSMWALRDDQSGAVVGKFISRHVATDPDTIRSLVGDDAPVRIEDADGRLFGICNEDVNEGVRVAGGHTAQS